MKKFLSTNKSNLINYLLIIIITLITIYVITKGNLYADTNDFLNQHIMFPDYFRKLFYQTGSLFPNYAPSLGGGQNIYNFAYYGFLSPLILPSYLLPFLPMIDYIIITNIINLIVSSILMYNFLKKHNFSNNLSLTGALMFSLSPTILLHYHSQLMFVNYLPFLILGLFGLDKYFRKQKLSLFIVSVFLMIMTSYYYSVGGLLALGIYALVSILSKPNLTIKIFFEDLFKLLGAVAISLLMSMCLLLPTITCILTSRGTTLSSAVTLKELFLPDLSLKSLLYGNYNLGLSALSVLALISIVRTKDKKSRFLSLFLILISIIPLFQYLLNGFLYIRPKVLIPFIPLYILLTITFLDNLLSKNINLKYLLITTIILSLLFYFSGITKLYYLDLISLWIFIILYYKLSKPFLIYVPLVLSFLIIGISSNITRDYLTKGDRNKVLSADLTHQIETILKDDTTDYRFGNYLDPTLNFNHIYTPNYKTTSTYSSVYNSYYKDFNDLILNNSKPSRNILNTATTPNIFASLFLNHKYIISNTAMLGYSKLDNTSNIYQSSNTLPTYYISSNLLSTKDFSNLEYPYTLDTLLTNTIVDSNTTNYNPSHLEKVNILDYLDLSSLPYSIDNSSLTFSKTTTYNLPTVKDLSQKIIIITFDLTNKQSCSLGDQTITINNITNKKTCKSWLYYNDNTHMSFILGEGNITNLNITFAKGTYNLQNINMYLLDYSEISNLNANITKLDLDTDNNYLMSATVTVPNDNSYFVTSLPYDSNYQIKIDGHKVSSEIVNTSFLGSKITKGTHKITISYTNPYQTIGLILSLVGLIIYLLLLKKEKFSKHLY